MPLTLHGEKSSAKESVGLNTEAQKHMAIHSYTGGEVTEQKETVRDMANVQLVVRGEATPPVAETSAEEITPSPTASASQQVSHPTRSVPITSANQLLQYGLVPKQQHDILATTSFSTPRNESQGAVTAAFLTNPVRANLQTTDANRMPPTDLGLNSAGTILSSKNVSPASSTPLVPERPPHLATTPTAEVNSVPTAQGTLHVCAVIHLCETIVSDIATDPSQCTSPFFSHFCQAHGLSTFSSFPCNLSLCPFLC